jgi:hypothetical protein
MRQPRLLFGEGRGTKNVMATTPPPHPFTLESIRPLMDLLNNREEEWRFSVEHVWKINLTVWAALSLFLVSDYRTKSHVPHGIVIAGMGVVLLGHLLWLFQGRHAIRTLVLTNARMHQNIDHIMASSGLLRLPVNQVPPKPERRWLQRILSYNHFYVDASITISLVLLNIFNWVY